jgi:hypothetical protein
MVVTESGTAIDRSEVQSMNAFCWMTVMAGLKVTEARD